MNGIYKKLTAFCLSVAFSAHPLYAGFLYTLQDRDGQPNRIRGFSVNETNGTLTALPGFPVGTLGNGDDILAAQRLAFDFINNRLFALNGGEGTISSFAVNPTTGALSPLGNPFSILGVAPAGEKFTCIAVHPNGSIVVIGDANGDVHSFKISGTDVSLAPNSPITTGSAKPFSIVFSQNGNILQTGGNSGKNIAIFTVNASTGELFPVGPPVSTGAAFPVGFVMDRTNRLFLANSIAQRVRAFNADGLLTTAFSGLTQARHGALHAGGFYMVADAGSNQVGVFEIEGSGQQTTLSAVAGSPFNTDGTFTHILALNKTNGILFAANGLSRNITAFNVSQSGALTLISTTEVNTLGFSGFVSGMVHSEQVKEPEIDIAVPNRVLVTGGRIVTLIGENMSSLTGITVGSNAATNLTVVDDGAATIIAPSNTGGFKNIKTTFLGEEIVIGDGAILYVGLVNRTLTVPGGTKVKNYRMLSIPLAGGITSADSAEDGTIGLSVISPLAKQLQNVADFTNIKVARIFRFNGQNYDEAFDILGDDLGAGRGFWGIFAQDLNATFSGGNMNQVTNQVPDPPFPVLMHPGWNQVSHAVAGLNVSAFNAFVTNGDQIFRVPNSNNTLSNREFFKFTGFIANPYVVAEVINGKESYWLFNNTNGTIILFFGEPLANDSTSDAVSNSVAEFLKKDVSKMNLPSSVKYAMAGNVKVIRASVLQFDSSSPPLPPSQTIVSGDGGSGGGGGCFIATAAYGTNLDSRIRALSELRDQSLLRTSVGRDFTFTYYSNSRAAARYLRKTSLSRAIARKLLRPVVSAAE